MMLPALCPNVNRKRTARSLVLFPGSLGDFVCALPAIQEVQRRFQNDLVLAARGEAIGLSSLLFCVKEVRSLEERVFSQLFSPSNSFDRETIDFFSSFSKVISWYAHSRREVTENLRSLVGERLSSFSFFSGQDDCHAVAYYLRCLGVEPLQCPSLYLSEQSVQWRSDYWRQRRFGSSILILQPGSGGKGKRWEVAGFKKVAQWWQAERRGKILVLLGPAEEGETEQWRDSGAVEIGLPLWQVAALLSQSAFYLGNDSGVSHLAGAVGARGVVVFGPTRPQLWRPLGGSLTILHNTEYRKISPLTPGISLDEIPAEQVIEKLIAQGA